MAELNNSNAPEENLTEVVRVRREKLETLKEKGKNPFEITHFDGVVSSEYIKENFEHLEGTPVRVAGRIISKRIMGKASFFHIEDGAGRIQGYARKDVMGEELTLNIRLTTLAILSGWMERLSAQMQGKFRSNAIA